MGYSMIHLLFIYTKEQTSILHSSSNATHTTWFVPRVWERVGALTLKNIPPPSPAAELVRMLLVVTATVRFLDCWDYTVQQQTHNWLINTQQCQNNITANIICPRELYMMQEKVQRLFSEWFLSNIVYKTNPTQGTQSYRNSSMGYTITQANSMLVPNNNFIVFSQMNTTQHTN